MNIAKESRSHTMTSPQALSHEEIQKLRGELKQMAHLIERFEQHRDEIGAAIPGSYAQAMVVLLDFHDREEHPTLTDLVELLNIDKSNVTRLCQRMQDAGHIWVKRDDRDRRAKRLGLTTSGLELGRALNQSSMARFGLLLASLGPEDREQMLSCLAQLNKLMTRQLR